VSRVYFERYASTAQQFLASRRGRGEHEHGL